MASTQVTITVPEADLEDAIKAVCFRAGLEPKASNVKQAISIILNRWIEQDRHTRASITKPNIE